MEKGDRIYVAGHTGLVGSAIVRRLRVLGYVNVLMRLREEVDLCRWHDVSEFILDAKPDYVFLAAALVGGIGANTTKPADFIRENLQVQTNVIEAAHRYGVQKLLFLGSSCIYPREAPQPIHESALMTGPLEPTNSAYAVAKIAGIEMLKAYREQYGFQSVAVQPTNLYGPGDNYDPGTSHVLPALIRRFHEAKQGCAEEVTLWGTGEPRREFLHVDDCAAACVQLMQDYEEPGIVNVGCGEDMTIRSLAHLVAEIVDYKGAIKWDPSKPDGTPRKLLDVSKLKAMGWAPTIPLHAGIRASYMAWRAEGT